MAEKATGDDDFNGQVTSKYAWSQTITDLDVKIPVDPGILKGYQVTVDIQSDGLSVQLLRNPGESEHVVSGQFTYPVVKQDSYWTLSPGKHITLFLQKKQERWWVALLIGEPGIDMKKIEPVRDMSELQEDEQAKIQEMMYNQKQKWQGRPTSDEQKMHNILKDAWDKEGSPFKGQPFDPSLVNCSNTPGSFGNDREEAEHS